MDVDIDLEIDVDIDRCRYRQMQTSWIVELDNIRYIGMGIDTDAQGFARDPGGPGSSVKNVVEDGLKPLKPQEHPRRWLR